MEEQCECIGVQWSRPGTVRQGGRCEVTHADLGSQVLYHLYHEEKLARRLLYFWDLPHRTTFHAEMAATSLGRT